jgi:F-type H+-transporting ATPase subunit b
MLIDWFTVAAQVINFLILVWLLKRFLYKPVLAAIDEREKRIAAQLQDAEKRKADALKEQANFRQKNEDFDKQRAALLLEAANAAQSERAKLLAAARAEAEGLRAQLQKTVSAEREDLNRKIATLAQQEVFSIARKILADLADASLETRMADIFIHRLRDIDDKQRSELNGWLNDSSKRTVVRSAFEMAQPQKTAIEDAVKSLSKENAGIDFEVRPDLIGGIELAANGHKIEWSIAGYLATLKDSVGALLEPKVDPAPAPAPAAPVPHAD